MRISCLFSVALLLASHLLFSQTKPNNPWTAIPETFLKSDSPDRQIVPKAYRTLQLDVAQLSAILAAAPMWQTAAAETEVVVLAFPMPDGTFQRFRIVEAPVMHPDLAAQFPMIKSYAGIGLDDPLAYARFDLTQRGFHGMVRTPNSSTVFIDPYAVGDTEHYIAYYKKDFHKGDPFECLFEEVNKPQEKAPPHVTEKAGDCQFRTYVLALACTGEYASFHGGTTALVLAAMNTTMTRVNGVFETDASIHMDLHPNTSSLIFLNANTDPYTNDDGGTMLGENQTTCDNIIGNANYDIGHVFSTGGGGVAYLGAVCTNSLKAGGVTGSASPIGDPFDIDYVAHEMGHQYGANHTQNNACNRNNATAMEPGSASTIMGYAGICSPNVQSNSDDYFHAVSLGEMAAEVTSNNNGGGNTCSTNTTFNSAPTANAGADYTIPISTPFVLTGTGTDPNGDPITYTWEQMNNTVATMPPVSTNTGGPAFRSFKGTTSPSRYLPRLQDLVNNVSPTWEVLASVGRTYAWRLTVRDNHIGGGCTAEDNMVVTVSNTSGPFVVTAPNTAVNWPALSTQTVTWNVAGTTGPPVSCANVDIFLSLDGGFTYPIVLATATANDGSQDVAIPNNQTTTARVMVKGNGNIFFDISNTNFTISAPVNGFTVDVAPNSQAICAPSNAVFTANIGVTGTFSGNVTLSTGSLPAGATADFTANPVAAPGSSQLTLGNLAAVAPGTYNIEVIGISGTQQIVETVTLSVSNGLPAAATLTAPSNGATGVSLTPTLVWTTQPGVGSFELDLALDAGFTNIILHNVGLISNSLAISNALSTNTQYFWRVRAVNGCGTGDWSSVFSFTTLNLVCNTFASTDVPKAISASGTPTITSTLNVGVSGTITDVNVTNLDIDHTWINDLVVKLKSPANTELTLLNQICGSQNNILINLDDESTNAYSSIPCPPTGGGTYQPFQSLSGFDGQDLSGTWTLTVQDLANEDGGTLQAWSIAVCYAGIPTLTASTSGTNVSCFGGNNGTASASASGGTGVYAYAWSNGGNTQTITGLAIGNYTVTVTSGTQTTTSSVTILQPAQVVINAPSVTQPTCATPTGTIVVNATGSGLEYSINGGTSFQTGNTFSGLSAGAYNIVVRLQSDPTCSTAYGNNPVNINPVPTAPAVNAPAVTQPTCATPTGTIVVNATGSGLEYSINGGTSFQTSSTFSGLSAGAYNIVVRLQSDPTCATTYGNNPVNINPVPTAPMVNAPAVTQPTCATPTGTIVVNATGSGLEYSINGGTSFQTGSTFSGLSAGAYNIVVRLQSNPTCSTAYGNNPVNINPVPTAPTVLAPSVTQPTCAVPTGTIVVNATGSGLEYSINGGTSFQTGNTFSGLSAGTYNIVVRLQSDPTCSTLYGGNPVNINPVPTAPAVNAPSVTQPTCAVPTGTIVVNATGSGLEYSINGGTSFQTGSTFSGLSAGAYNIVVRLQSDPTCATLYGGNPVNINPVPTAPMVNAPAVTQPTCATPTGTIVVNATGSGLEYSINGGTSFQTSSTFSGLSAGAYNIVVRLQSDPTCATTYGNNPVNINAVPIAPAVNAPSVTQPTCATPTGTIVVNATGSGLEYSINGGTSFQTSSTFSGLSAGAYNIVVRLQSNPTCSTAYGNNPVNINPVPTAPAVNAPSVTQPTCATPTGTIVVNATGSGLEYSINGGTSFQTGSTFSGLSAGAYNIVVRLQSNPTCSTAYGNNPVNINPVPTAPTVLAPSVTQPTCATPTGTIVVNATGSGLEYSINGGTSFQTGNTFSGLSAGAYNIVVRLQSNPTCSTAYGNNPVNINAVPTAPMVNTPSVTQPTCATPTGTIVVNATGSGLEYSINGGTSFQTSSTFSGLSAGAYNIVIRLQSDPTCSTAYGNNPVNINPVPTAPMVNTPSVTQPTCATPTGTIVVNATGSGLEYSINGGTSFQTGSTFSGLSAGAYNIVVRLQSDPTCSTAYGNNPVNINPVPTAPTVNAPSVTQPTCATPTGTIVVNATGSGLEYSINGGTSFQTSSTFSGLLAGAYNIVVRLQSDLTCSTAYGNNPVNINAVPTAPAVNAPSVTQPTCATPTGTIVVNATGSGLEYSINGGTSFQTGSTFSGLSAGAYNIVVRLQSDPTCSTLYGGNPVELLEATNCCPNTLIIDNTPIADGIYQAAEVITSMGLVPNGGNVVFGAWNTVELQPNFEVGLGGVFEIVLQGCTQ